MLGGKKIGRKKYGEKIFPTSFRMVFARGMTNSGRSINNGNDDRGFLPVLPFHPFFPSLSCLLPFSPSLSLSLSLFSFYALLFTFKYEVNEQGDFVINDTGKKSCAHSPLPGLIIQAKGVVSRLVSPLSPYLGTTRVARRETEAGRLPGQTLNRPYLLTGVCD